MWRVDGCFIHGTSVFCHWMCRWDVSVIPFRMCLFFIMCFGLVVMDFDLSFPVGDKFFLPNDKWNSQLVIELR